MIRQYINVARKLSGVMNIQISASQSSDVWQYHGEIVIQCPAGNNCARIIMDRKIAVNKIGIKTKTNKKAIDFRQTLKKARRL